jgi:TonB family protein
LLTSPTIAYPEHAAARDAGELIVAFIINPDGTTRLVRAARSSGHPDLDEAALSAIGLWKFSPILMNSIPIAFPTMRSVSFAPPGGSAGPAVSVSDSCATWAASPRGTSAIGVGVHSTVYPQAALADREEGRVKLSFTIATNGSTTDPHVIDSSGHPLLDQAAIVSLKTWLYEPVAAPIKHEAIFLFPVPDECKKSVTVTVVGSEPQPQTFAVCLRQ